ncbi:MAG: amidohydrolase family protein, partial [Spirochaetes bacterium]|nr:amidohydrolase family protein [Spirochaetota bacterium]
MLDLKIRNGSVPDFEAGAMLAADIGVKDGMIVSVGRVEEAAKAEIDAEGLVVSPGFIDIHMHEETLVPGAPEPYDIARYMLAMGVTTAAAGNCGNTRQAVRDFLDFIDANGSPINYLTFAGHNSIRARAGVASPYEAATPAQIEAMAGLVAEDIEAGAIGLSFGLEYSPAVSFAEMIGAAGGAAGREILLSAHYRSDGPDGLSSVRELIALSEETGQAMQVSHLVSCTGFGDMRESLESLAAAKARGVDVLADSYPYDAFCTRIGSAVFDDGCFERWGKGFGAIRFLQEPLRGTTCDEASFRLAREEYPDSLVAAFVMNDDEAVMAIAHPLVIVASDGIYNRGFGHPRGAGAFPRVLGRYSREREALSLV